MEMYAPVLLVVLSNTVYHICSKSTPGNISPFASLAATYGVGMLFCLAAFFLTAKDTTIAAELRKLNWASYLLGIAVVGLEAGFLWMYQAGWTVSIAQIVSSALLAIVLIIVGALIFREAITVKKVAGILICLVGLYFIQQ